MEDVRLNSDVWVLWNQQFENFEILANFICFLNLHSRAQLEYYASKKTSVMFVR